VLDKSSKESRVRKALVELSQGQPKEEETKKQSALIP
jgi:hypothetical protein